MGGIRQPSFSTSLLITFIIQVALYLSAEGTNPYQCQNYVQPTGCSSPLLALINKKYTPAYPQNTNIYPFTNKKDLSHRSPYYKKSKRKKKKRKGHANNILPYCAANLLKSYCLPQTSPVCQPQPPPVCQPQPPPVCQPQPPPVCQPQPHPVCQPQPPPVCQPQPPPVCQPQPPPVCQPQTSEPKTKYIPHYVPYYLPIPYYCSPAPSPPPAPAPVPAPPAPPPPPPSPLAPPLPPPLLPPSLPPLPPPPAQPLPKPKIKLSILESAHPCYPHVETCSCVINHDELCTTKEIEPSPLKELPKKENILDEILPLLKILKKKKLKPKKPKCYCLCFKDKSNCPPGTVSSKKVCLDKIADSLNLAKEEKKVQKKCKKLKKLKKLLKKKKKKKIIFIDDDCD